VKRFPPEVILWGGTGQAKVVRPIIEHHGSKVVAVFDDTKGLKSPFPDVPVYQGVEGFKTWIKKKDPKKVGFCVAIGNPYGRARLRIADMLIKEGLTPVTVIHPTAWIAESAIIGEGAQILAGAIIGVEARLGRQCIVNTNASVDHESTLDDGVEIAPAATLSGLVHVGVNGWIGGGAIVLPRKKIGADAVVGAGAVVIKDVPEKTTVVGVPAKPLIKQKGK